MARRGESHAVGGLSGSATRCLLLLRPRQSPRASPFNPGTWAQHHRGCTRIYARQCLNPFKDEEGWSQAPEEGLMPRASETHCPSGTLLPSLTSVSLTPCLLASLHLLFGLLSWPPFQPPPYHYGLAPWQGFCLTRNCVTAGSFGWAP